MLERFARFPEHLATRSRSARLGASAVPVLLAHPDWARPAPVALWLHGRTVSKELDPGRYLRWIRAGVAAAAIDLPGHGERGEEFHSATRTIDLLEQVIPEIDQVASALGDREWRAVFDVGRLGIGGMSAGGMAVLRRLCEAHPFRCAAVEGTTGNLEELYFGERKSTDRAEPRSVARHDPERVARLDPMKHLEGWRPIPLLVVHSEGDRVIPWGGMLKFIERVREHYRSLGADPSMVEVLTWAETGAPEEHMGFGRYSNDAKNAQTEFFRRHLGG